VAELPITGHCLCGGVHFEIDAPLGPASYCHCTRCQRRTGAAASAQARLAPGSLRFTAGADLIREYDPGDGGFAKAFCSSCGSALYSRDPSQEHPFSVRLGVLDDPGVRPSYRQFVAYAAPWAPIPDDGLPRHDESATRPRTPPRDR
jgi:hypothetical protein